MNVEKFGKFIADQRKAQGMTQSDLGSIIGVTDKAVSKWERGLGFPDISTLIPLADALHVSIDELMKSEKNMTEEVSSEAILNTISIADEQLKRIERRSIFRSIGFIAMLMLLIIVGENSKPESMLYAGFFIYLPITCMLSGLVLLLRSFYQKKKGKPYQTTLRVGLCLIGVVVMVLIFFFIVGIAGFPGQQ